MMSSRAAVVLWLFTSSLWVTIFRTRSQALLKILITTPVTKAEEVLLNTEENQDLPREHSVTGSSQCTGHAVYGEEVGQNHP